MRGEAFLRAVGLGLLLGMAACGGDRHEVASAASGQEPSDAGSGIAAVDAAEPPVPDCRLCFGKMTRELQVELTHRALGTKSCYDQAIVRALQRKGRAQGRLMIRVRVGESGSLCSEKTVADEIGDPELARCAREAFEGPGLPAPVGGCIDVNVPLSFVPADAGAGGGSTP